MSEHLWDEAEDIEKQIREFEIPAVGGSSSSSSSTSGSSGSSGSFFDPSSGTTTTTSASKEMGSDALSRPRKRRLIAGALAFILFMGIVVGMAISFPKSYGLGGDDPINSTDEVVSELIPPDPQRKRDTLPRRGSLPNINKEKAFRDKPGFPPRVRSSTPREPKQVPEDTPQDTQTDTASSNSEDQD